LLGARLPCPRSTRQARTVGLWSGVPVTVKKLLGILVQAILFGGPTLAPLLASTNLFGKAAKDFAGRHQLGFGVALTLLFFLAQCWASWTRPAARIELHTARNAVLMMLRDFLREYVAQLPANQQVGGAGVRANIMLPARLPIVRWIQECWRRGRLIRPKALVIAHSLAPGNAYAQAELDTLWFRGEGACGSAWERGETYIHPANGTPPRLTAAQNVAVQHLASVASFPLVWEGKVIGVLNLDSQLPTSETQFDIQRIQLRLAASVEDIAAILPWRDGVVL
jgi:GAF domain-containing protein